MTMLISYILFFLFIFLDVCLSQVYSQATLLSSPSGVSNGDELAGAIQSFSGDLFVCDLNNHKLRVYSWSSNYSNILITFGTGAPGLIDGGLGGVDSQLNRPCSVAIISSSQDEMGKAIFIDNGSKALRFIHLSNYSISTIISDAFSFTDPRHIAVDAYGRFAFVSDAHAIAKVDLWADPVVVPPVYIYENTRRLGGSGGPSHIRGLVWSHLTLYDKLTPFLYLIDINSRLIRVDENGHNVTLCLGSDARAGNDDGYINVATLNEPRGLSVDDYGTLYIMDSQSHRLRRVQPPTNDSNAFYLSTIVGYTNPINTTSNRMQTGVYYDPASLYLDESLDSVVVSPSHNGAQFFVSLGGRFVLFSDANARPVFGQDYQMRRIGPTSTSTTSTDTVTSSSDLALLTSSLSSSFTSSSSISSSSMSASSTTSTTGDELKYGDVIIIPQQVIINDTTPNLVIITSTINKNVATVSFPSYFLSGSIPINNATLLQLHVDRVIAVPLPPPGSILMSPSFALSLFTLDDEDDQFATTDRVSSSRQFYHPVSISFASASLLPSSDYDLKKMCLAYYHDDEGWLCEDSNLIVDASEGSISGRTRHFTPFALLLTSTNGPNLSSNNDNNASSITQQNVIIMSIIIPVGMIAMLSATLLYIRYRQSQKGQDQQIEL
eukprot:TRINITY_DN8626_c0_g2_i2.p1 TRINITY_DN8626_c0_g2~~TRINITY_DN8626_c0_g2_i2.p1  ORF type:complete len:663 (+),score=122.01 TRINITY_DN8626_c0_g2_i2:817-2805(+)